MKLSGFLKGVIYASLAVIPMLAWFVSESTFFPYITGKNFAFRFLIEISLVAWVALAILEPAYRPKKSLLFYSYTFFLGVMCLANIFGANPYLSFFSNFERSEGWFTHLHLFVYFTILYSVYKTDKDWLKMLGWFVVGNVAVSMQGVFQILGQKDFFLTKIYSSKVVSFINEFYPTASGNGLRLDSTLGNAAYYGIFTLFFAFLGAMMAIKAKNWKGNQGCRSVFMVVGPVFLVLASKFFNGSISPFIWLLGIIGLIFGGYNFAKKYSEGEIGSWPFAVVALLNAFLLFYTQTRGSYFGLAGGIVVATAVFMLSKEGRQKYTKTIKYLMGAAVAIVVVLAAMFAMRDTSVMQNSVIVKRISTIKLTNIVLHPVESFNLIADNNVSYPQLVNYFGEATIVSRFLNAKMSIEGVSDSAKNLILGYGQENYTTVFSKHFDPRMYQQEAWFDRAHNVFFDWLVAGGIVGLLAYLALYFTPVYMLWYGKGKSNLSLAERSILTGTLAGYFIHNIFVFDNITSLIVFVLILAYIASRTRDTESHIKDESKDHKHASNVVMYGYLSAASIVSILLFVFTVYKPLSANMDVISSLRAVNAMSTYSDVPAATKLTLAYFKSALATKSYGDNEILEQMVSRVADLSSLDFTKIPDDKRADTIKDYQELKSLAETKYSAFIERYPAARGYSLYSSYMRMMGDLDSSKTYGQKAVAIAPKKQSLVIDYIETLMARKEYVEAYDLAKSAYESEKTFIGAEEVYIKTAAYAGKKAEAKSQLESLRSRNVDAAKKLDAELVALLK